MTVNRTQLQKLIESVDYPTDRPTLVSHARESGAGDDVLRSLEALPEERFNSPKDVSDAVRDQ